MADRFNEFMKPLKETHFSLSDYVDFPKVIANVEDISINLNLLNYHRTVRHGIRRKEALGC